MVLLPLPLSPTSATISPAADGEVGVVDGVQRTCWRSTPPTLKCLVSPRSRAAARRRHGHRRTSSAGRRSSTAARPARPLRLVPDGAGLAAGRRVQQATGPRRAHLVELGRDVRQQSSMTPPGSAGGTGSRGGGRARSGGAPGSRSAAPAARGPTGTRRAAPGCTGGRGVEDASGSAPASTTWPAYMTMSWSEKWLTSDMSWVTKTTANPSSSLQFLDLHHQRALRDHVERRGRLVHDDEVRREQQRHRDHRPLPHPAAELVRIALQVDRVDADQSQYLGRALRICRPDILVRRDRVLELRADGRHRVEGVHRALHDHRVVTPAQRRQLLRRSCATRFWPLEHRRCRR